MQPDPRTEGMRWLDQSARVIAIDPAFGDLSPDAAGLDVYYIPTRYPGGLPGGLPADAFDEVDSERALARASGIVDRVRRAFGASG